MLGWADSSAGSSADKESACNAGDPGLIPGSGGSAGEGIGYPLQYSWASLVAQTVNNWPKKKKNWPAMRETWVQSLGWEEPPEEAMATHGEGNGNPQQSSCLENSWQATVPGITESDMTNTHQVMLLSAQIWATLFGKIWGEKTLLFEIYWTSHKRYISKKWHLGSVLPSTYIKFRTDTRTVF